MKNYQILQEALDKATQKGAFTLQETGIIVKALIDTRQDLEALENFRKAEEANKVPADNTPDQKAPANSKKK